MVLPSLEMVACGVESSRTVQSDISRLLLSAPMWKVYNVCQADPIAGDVNCAIHAFQPGFQVNGTPSPVGVESMVTGSDGVSSGRETNAVIFGFAVWPGKSVWSYATMLEYTPTQPNTAADVVNAFAKP